MKTGAKRFDWSGRAALCAAALSLAALAQGCGHGSSAPAAVPPPAGAEARAMFVQPSPVKTAQTTPAQASPAAESPLPPPEGFVNDFAEVIDAETERLLEERLARLKARARIEIVVATVETTGAQSIFDYSLAVARGWGIGPPAGEGGGGVLLLLATKDRRWQIHVSRSLEGDLPDDVAGEIGRSMTASLRAANYGEAVDGCVDGLVKRLAERRGFSTEEDELILQSSPEENPKPSKRPDAGGRRKSAPHRKP